MILRLTQNIIMTHCFQTNKHIKGNHSDIIVYWDPFHYLTMLHIVSCNIIEIVLLNKIIDI